MKKILIFHFKMEFTKELPLLSGIKEAAYNQFLNQSNIIKFKNIKIVGDKINFIMDKYSRLTRKEDLNYLIPDIIKAMYYLHINKLIHSDIKPSNIMYDEKNIKYVLIDLGLISTFKFFEARPDVRGGTSTTMAPELLFPKYIPRSDPGAIDIFSFGVTLLILITGKTWFSPSIGSAAQFRTGNFDREYRDLLIEQLQKQDFLSKIPDTKTRDLISSCMQILPRNRPTAKDLMNQYGLNVVVVVIILHPKIKLDLESDVSRLAAHIHASTLFLQNGINIILNFLNVENYDLEGSNRWILFFVALVINGKIFMHSFRYRESLDYFKMFMLHQDMRVNENDVDRLLRQVLITLEFNLISTY